MSTVSRTIKSPKSEATSLRDHAIRLTDIMLSAAALLFLAPLMLVAAAAVFALDGHNPIFRQERIGRNGRRFRCLKFRSMRPDAGERLARLLEEDPAARIEWERDHKLKSDPRVTRIGGFLRRSSIDELPQFLNVLKGDMSLVGPRPIVDAESRRYGRRFRQYCAQRPGLTGLWQVSGRSSVGYRRRVACDVVYSQRRSYALNLVILFSTIPAVLSGRGSC